MLLLAALGLACGPQSDPQTDGPRDPDEGQARRSVEELPPRPPFPESRNGRLVAVTAGDYEIQGEWRASAGICEEIGVVEMYAGPPGLGTALLIRLRDDEPLGEYPVVAAAAVFPPAPVVLIAVQAFEGPNAFGFQAFHGSLDLLELGDKVSGRFTTTLREVSIDLLTHYVGVFEKIPLGSLATDYCGALRDSMFADASASDPDSGAAGN